MTSSIFVVNKFSILGVTGFFKREKERGMNKTRELCKGFVRVWAKCQLRKDTVDKQIESTLRIHLLPFQSTYSQKFMVVP